MRLKSIVKNILTERRSQGLTIEATSETFLKNARAYNTEATQIFRGITGFDAEWGVINPKAGKSKRTSQNTQNFYTLIIDNSEEWEHWPKRSQSIICSTSATYAASYGSLYLVIPFNGAEIGVAPAKDIWYSFSDFNLRHFNEALDSLYVDLFNKTLPDKSIERFKNSVNTLGRKLKSQSDYSPSLTATYSPMNETAEKLVKMWRKSNEKTFFEFLSNIFSPYKNNFQVHTYDPNFRVSEGVEVWTSSKSILIRDDKIEAFFEHVNEISQGLHYNYGKVIERYGLDQT